MRQVFGWATSKEDYIARRVSPEPNTGCWLWLGPHNMQGYPQICKTSIFGRYMQAHRGVYETLVGPIPDDLELDHECHCRSCVNPEHLKPVTRKQNAKLRMRDQSHCKQGHAFSGGNLMFDKRGWRKCRVCMQAAQVRYKSKGRRLSGRKSRLL